MKLTGIQKIEVIAHKSKNLDTLCYRGSAPLAHLALISQPDVFDQVTNPDGLQRDLSPKHASDAYDYVTRDRKSEFPRAFPEVVLNVRDKKILEIRSPAGAGAESTDPASPDTVGLLFDISAIQGNRIYVSRVDGNHRLWYAAGDERRDPVLSDVPFQIHVGLSREQERAIFVDINSNQKGLNTSHLAIMKGRLTPEEEEVRDHPERWIATKLSRDPLSPWHGLIHLGGSKRGTRAQGLTRLVNFASIQSGVQKLLSKSQYIHDLNDPEVKYILIRNYWNAVKKVFAEEWGNPSDYLLLKNIGVWSLSLLGAAIIDRCMPQHKVQIDDMGGYLSRCRSTFDWRKDATGQRAVSGMSGNQAALILAGEMAQELSDEGSGGFKELQEALKNQAVSASLAPPAPHIPAQRPTI